MLSRRHLLLGHAEAGCGGVLANEAFPSCVIKIVVPFPPGTPSEIVVRRNRGSARGGV